MGMPADKLKDLKDQGDIQVINEAYSDRVFRQFGFLIKLRVRPGSDDRSPQVNYVCCKVLPHSYKVENQTLLKRLQAYKQKIGFVDKPFVEQQSRQRKQIQAVDL